MALRCVSIGECMLELSGTAGDYSLAFGGDTLNAAVYMSRHGVSVDYLTALGRDSYSNWMLESWQAEGVGTALVRQVEGRLPGFYIIETADDGERSFHYWRHEAPACELLDGADAEDILSSLFDYEYLYLSGISLSVLNRQGRSRLLDFLYGYRDAGGLIVFDSNFRLRGWPCKDEARSTFDEVLGVCHTALPSLGDEQLLYPGSDAMQVLDRYRSMGTSEVVVKCGEQGCLAWSTGSGTTEHAFTSVQAVDTTAAGDSFNGTYIAARMQGSDQQQAIKIAHSVASKVVQHRGAIIPRKSLTPKNPLA